MTREGRALYRTLRALCALRGLRTSEEERGSVLEQAAVETVPPRLGACIDACIDA